MVALVQRVHASADGDGLVRQQPLRWARKNPSVHFNHDHFHTWFSVTVAPKKLEK